MIELDRDGFVLRAHFAVEDFLHGVGGIKEPWTTERAKAVFADSVRYQDHIDPERCSYLSNLANVMGNHALSHKDTEGAEFFRYQKESWRKLGELLSLPSQLV